MYSTSIIVHFNKKSNRNFASIVFLYKSPIEDAGFWRLSRQRVGEVDSKMRNRYFELVFPVKINR